MGRKTVKSLGILRILFFGILYLTTTSDYLTYFSYLPAELICPAVGGWYPLNLSFTEASRLLLIYKVFLVFSAIGLFCPIAFWVSFGSFFLINFSSIKFCFSNHNYYPLHIAIFLWALLDNSSGYRLDSLWRKPKEDTKPLPIIFFLRIHFCIIFFLSGISKLIQSGFEWVFSNNLANLVIMQRFYFDSFSQAQWFGSLNKLVANAPGFILMMMAGLTILIEVSAPLALFFKRLRYPIIVSIFLLQVGIYLVMYVNFVAWLPLYLCWFVKDEGLYDLRKT